MSEQTQQRAEFDRAVAAFHDALDAGPAWVAGSHGREGDWVDLSAEAVVKALLAAGWAPPQGPP